MPPRNKRTKKQARLADQFTGPKQPEISAEDFIAAIKQHGTAITPSELAEHAAAARYAQEAAERAGVADNSVAGLAAETAAADPLIKQLLEEGRAAVSSPFAARLAEEAAAAAEFAAPFRERLEAAAAAAHHFLAAADASAAVVHDPAWQEARAAIAQIGLGDFSVYAPRLIEAPRDRGDQDLEEQRRILEMLITVRHAIEHSQDQTLDHISQRLAALEQKVERALAESAGGIVLNFQNAQTGDVSISNIAGRDFIQGDTATSPASELDEKQLQILIALCDWPGDRPLVEHVALADKLG